MCCRVVRRPSRRPIGHTAPEAGASPRSAAMMMTRHRDGPGRPTRRRARSSLMNSAEEGGSRCTDRRRRSRWPLFVGRADDRRTPRVEPALARARARKSGEHAGRAASRWWSDTHTPPGRRGTLAHRAVRKLGEVTALGVKEQSRRHRQEHRIPRVARTHDVPGHMARERGIVREKPRCDSRDHGVLARLLAAHRERSQQWWGGRAVARRRKVRAQRRILMRRRHELDEAVPLGRGIGSAADARISQESLLVRLRRRRRRRAARGAVVAHRALAVVGIRHFRKRACARGR